MKSFLVILSLFAALSFLSCRTQTLAPDSETATIRGQAFLATNWGNDPRNGYLQPYAFAGIQVSVDNTPYASVTDDSGHYEFKTIPTGTYNVRFSKPGYGDIRWFGVEVQGGGNAPIYWSSEQPWHNVVWPTLYKQSDLVATLQSTRTIDTAISGYPAQLNVILSGSYQASLPTDYYEMAIYFSHKPSVSSRPGEYEWYTLCHNDSPDTVRKTFSIPINFLGYRQEGFKSGDSAYVAVYGAPYYGMAPYFDYYDPTIGQPVLTSLNQTPSPVIGFKVP